MKNLYKEIFDEVKPNEKLLDSVFDMRARKKKKSLAPKLVSAVLALAVFGGSIGFGMHYQNDQSEQKITDSPETTYHSVANLNTDSIIGGLMVASAGEVIGQSNTELGYRIYVRDISGMSKQEIYDAKVEMLDKDLHLAVNDKATLKNGLKNDVKQNGNVIYATTRGTVYSELIPCNITKPDTVEEITVSNKSEYAELIVSCDDIYYTEPEKNVFVFDNRNVDYDLACIIGHNITVEGERYAQCRRIDHKSSKRYSYEHYYNKNSDHYMYEFTDINRSFYISYIYTDTFYDALGGTPGFDLADYNDEITLKVKFKDGYTATSVLAVSLNPKGDVTKTAKTAVKLVSYDYSK